MKRAPSNRMNHPDLDSPRVARAAAEAALRLAVLLNVSPEELARLLAVDTAEVDAWRQAPPVALSEPLLIRVSRLLQIYRSLRTLYPPEHAARWLHHPNKAPLYGGRTPLQAMLEDEGGLRATDLYLRAAAAGNW
jgi:hypothetical protein